MTVTKTNLRDSIIETFQGQDIPNKDFYKMHSTIILY
jgi:hypothetical protein